MVRAFPHAKSISCAENVLVFLQSRNSQATTKTVFVQHMSEVTTNATHKNYEQGSYDPDTFLETSGASNQLEEREHDLNDTSRSATCSTNLSLSSTFAAAASKGNMEEHDKAQEAGSINEDEDEAYGDIFQKADDDGKEQVRTPPKGNKQISIPNAPTKNRVHAVRSGAHARMLAL